MKVLHAFNAPRSGGGSLAASRASIKVLRDAGVQVEVFSRDSRDLPAGLSGRLSAGMSAFYPREAVSAFARTLKTFSPDLVHINELFPLISPWVLRECRERQVPVVMTVDDYHLTCPVRNHFREGRICTECLGGREYRAVLNNCRGNLAENLVNAGYNMMVRNLGLYKRHVDHYIAPSRFTADWVVQQLGVQAGRVTVVPHVIDIPPTAVDPSLGQYVAYAGRFVPEKGIDVLIDAARAMKLPLRLSRNEQHFNTIDLPPDVEVVVTRGRDDLAEFYRGARFLVVPSVWFESFGIVGAEAMSHGVPIIASRLGAVADLVEDGVDGLLFEAGNAADLARKAQQLWAETPQRLAEMGRRARDKACRLWGEQAHGQQLRAVYERSLSAQG
jgi:glycosyltransferase involved in cell wall biosynthesis